MGVFDKPLLDTDGLLEKQAPLTIKRVVVENPQGKPTVEFLLAILIREIQGLRADLRNPR